VYQNTVGRLTSVEFFAAIPPGLFVFLISHAWFSGGPSAEPPRSLWDYLLSLSTVLQENPAAILFALFGAYLFGSIIRSMPVRWAEKVATFGRSEFPYPTVLRSMLRQMSEEAAASDLEPKRLPKLESISSNTFNYWKDVLCIQAPGAFAFYQTFEARSRFFTSMFWAGVSGLVGGLGIAVQSLGRSWPLAPSIQLLVLSAILVVAFGLQLRRVREQEARVLLTLFSVLMQQGPVPSSPAGTAG
jgi:hypothetical protein